MQIDVISSVNEARAEEFNGRTAIVIDVLRATSTIITALEQGCTGVMAVETVTGAKSMQRPGDVLGGERFCKKIPGFDYGNSPFEYKTGTIYGKSLILTTTNGTRAIQKASKASQVLAGAFLNAPACAQAALDLGRDIIILCSGTQDVFSLEDGLCAGCILDYVTKASSQECCIGDFGLAMLHAYRSVSDNVYAPIAQSSNGKRLNKIGFADDVAYCCQTGITNVVPVLRDGVLIRT